jgi:hypothetical protein
VQPEAVWAYGDLLYQLRKTQTPAPRLPETGVQAVSSVPGAAENAKFLKAEQPAAAATKTEFSAP